VELTEREFEFNSGAVVDILSRLRAAGVHISIDDFGTGYSSLGMLSSVEVDQIKIDKLFVDEIMSDTLKGVKFIDSVVGLAEGLRLEVIAEGVEHQAQFDEVAPLVGGLQGYLLARPMPMAELIEFAHKKGA
jgi:EAL domain-containing protein (putative c-di-GMP-specific phosphodiesterase class I)